MSYSDDDVRRLILDMLKNPGERDKQRLIGASEIGNPCDYCVASRVAGREQAPNRYWLGAKIGTAIHRELEWEEEKHIVTPQNYRFEALEGALIEEKIILGEIEGYGVVKSKPDLVLVKYNHLIDHKTTTKDKLMKYKMFGVPKQYYYQQQLYAWGLNKSGIKIDRISLSFITRAGSTDADVSVISFDYDEAAALKAWGRLENICKYIQAGNDIELLTSDDNCYYCNNVINRN